MPERVAFCDPSRLETDYLAEFVAERRVPQNLFYFLNGAESFYSYRNEDLAEIAWQDEYRFFREKDFWSKSREFGFVSLGCGNAGAEKMLLRQMANDGYAVTYLGVDSSEKMLDLAMQNLEPEAFPQTYVLADFTDPDFAERLGRLVEDVDTRIFAMIGGTFGNFDQVQIAGILSDLVGTGDYLYLDVVPMYSSEEANERLSARLARLPDNLGRFFDRLLSALGLSRDDGELVSVRDRDGVLNTLRYTYLFRTRDAITLSCLGEEVVLAPGDEIQLLNVRAYDVDSLISFLGWHGFRFVDTYVPDVGRLSHLWQRFLFVKEDHDPELDV